MAGSYQVTAEILDKVEVHRTVTTGITILASPTETRRRKVIEEIRKQEQVLSAIALFLAIAGGVLFLYYGKPFGTLSDYITAFLWGFGLDSGVKGFAATFTKITAK